MSRTDHQVHHRNDDCPGTQSGVVAAPPTEPASPSRAVRDGVEADRSRLSFQFAPPIEPPRPVPVLEATRNDPRGPSERTVSPIHAADTEDPSLPSPPATLQIDAMDDIEESTSVGEPVDGNDNAGLNAATGTSEWTKERTSPARNQGDVKVGAEQVCDQAPQLNRRFFRGLDRATLIARRRRLRQARRRGEGGEQPDVPHGLGVEAHDRPTRTAPTELDERLPPDGDARPVTIEEDSHRASEAGPAGPMNASVRPIKQDSLIHIPEAILVEDGDQDVVIATPTLPWWKQRRSRILIALVIILAAASICGRVLSTKRLPAVESSNAPSLSSAPSSSPSACASKIISNSQKIELLLEDPQTPWLAVDGQNMIIAVQESGDVSHLFVIFFTLGGDGNWQRVNTIREDNWADYSKQWLEVAISGQTAFVGFHLLDIVVVYEQNQFGNWQRVEEPFVIGLSPYRFGYDVVLDGGLSSVTEWDKTHLFYQDGNRWVQFDTIEGGYLCSIAGDTIAMAIMDSDNQLFLQLYEYDSDVKRVFRSQESIPTGRVYSLDLSLNHLVYWDIGRASKNLNDTVIYRREEPNQKFIFLQQFNIPGAEIFDQLALHSDILVLTGDDYVHIFSEENGKWEEIIALDHRYQWAALTGRTIVAFDGEVDSFNIEDCTPEMQTQKPSLSIAPSWSSSSPSMIPSSSLVPSLSSAPTEINRIEVAIAYDDHPDDVSWELKRVVYESDDELVKYHQGSDGNTTHIESISLQEGEYKFIIYSCVGDGIGHYNVTSNGLLIAEGGDFGYSEVTPFLIPFGSRPSMRPSLSLPPSSSSPPTKSTSPSFAPSSTSSPAETCRWIEFAVFYDDHPEDAFWRLWRVVGDGDEPLRSHRGSAGDTSQVEFICVQEGEYKFTIYDYEDNGICCEHGEGRYNLTSNGALIVKGGEFQTSETTVFSIPFIESTSTTTRVDWS